uniref:Alkylated DNA repair protein alkB homolog 8 n=1 Tax=Panagrellus redivivus TaxID=6233 RepID=A0A7E4VUG0_PANRE
MGGDTPKAAKMHKKHAVALKKLARDGHKDIYSATPTCFIFASNTGFSSGMTPKALQDMFEEIKGVNYVQTYPKKSYSFACYHTPEAAAEAQAKFDQSMPTPLKLVVTCFFTKYIPEAEKPPPPILPKGLSVLNNFIDAETEDKLIEFLEARKDDFTVLKNRSVLHFGYEFNYDTNDAYKKSNTIPPEIADLIDKVKPFFKGDEPDQITVNYYRPGQNIPMHVDTHSAFEEPIVSLSIQSYIHIDFANLANPTQAVEVPLPERSLMVMTDESRYCYRHGIRQRVSDVHYETSTIIPRTPRYSITFRKIRHTPCECAFIPYCDWDRGGLTAVPDSEEAAKQIEESFVQNAYEEIADHFSETRHSKWRAVKDFLDEVPPHSLIIDAGCGNGKYLDRTLGHFMVGFDKCHHLLKIASTKGEVIGGCSSNIPLRAGIADVVICIAVVHHFAIAERRKRAVAEIGRLLKPGGRALITVWAFEQKTSAYSKMRSNRNDEEVQTSHPSRKLEIHDGTKFDQVDMLVPWQTDSNGKQVFRFYHLFVKDELEGVVNSIEGLAVEQSLYEEGNFIVIFRKV